MNKPRRTSELLQDDVFGSITKPSRVSRITQPRQLIQQRQSSDPTIQPVKYLSIGTSSKNQRSSSATPQRTPLHLKTPNRPILSREQVTAEKKNNDKNLITIESNRITEYLRVIEPILGKEFFDRGGIKNMSIKQFIIIVNFFLKSIARNRLSVDSNYVDSMAKILNELGYPNTIAKSWLKTPTAPHAFHNVISLFTWFLSFFPSNPLTKPIAQIKEYEQKYIIDHKDFPDKDYACKFVHQSREIFSAWNKGLDDVVEEAKLQLGNDMLQKVCDIEDLKNLEYKIKELNLINSDIQNELKETSRYEEFERIDAEYKLKTKELQKYENTCKKTSKEIKKLKSQIESKETLIKPTEKRIEKLKLSIKNQTINIKERDNIYAEIEANKNELKLKIEYIKRLQKEGTQIQVNFSRLVHRKTVLITKINTYIHKLSTEIKLLNSIDFNELYINKNSNIEDIDHIKSNIQKIFQQLNNDMIIIKDEILKLEKLIELLNTENEKISKPRLETLNNEIEDLNSNITQIDEVILLSTNKNEKNINELNAQIKELLLSKNYMLRELQTKTDKLNKLKESNAETWSDFENKMEDILTYKEKKLDELSKIIDNYYKTMQSLQLIYKTDTE